MLVGLLALTARLLWQPSRPETLSSPTAHEGPHVSQQRATVVPPAPARPLPCGPPSLPDGHVASSGITEQAVFDDLPPPYTETEIRRILSRASRDQIWRAQDEVMRAWPAYSEVRDQLRKELGQNMKLDAPLQTALVKAARRLRSRFWQAGGCLSATAYRHVYMARVLLEEARDLDPSNITVVDELVETIQSAHPLVMFEEDRNMVPNTEVQETLLGIRAAQFMLIKRSVEQGRDPTLQDFVQAFDLAVLQSRHDARSATRVVQWLQREAGRGRWSGYGNVLSRFLSALNEGRPFTCNIYAWTKASFPEDFRYGRRLPSFRGPDPARRGLVLWGADDSPIAGAVTVRAAKAADMD